MRDPGRIAGVAKTRNVSMIGEMSKYRPGVRVRYKGVNILGTVVENEKFPDDICIQWENGMFSSYDEWFLDINCEIVVLATACKQWGVE